MIWYKDPSYLHYYISYWTLFLTNYLRPDKVDLIDDLIKSLCYNYLQFYSIKGNALYLTLAQTIKDLIRLIWLKVW